MTEQDKIALESAVMDVVARETETFVEKDFKAWADCWAQDARTREVCVSSTFGTTVLEGWDRISREMRSVMATGDVCKILSVERINVSCTISGELAHVTFDQTSEHEDGRTEQTFETRVLEQQQGQWRILYSSFALYGHQKVDLGRLAVNAKGEILCAPETARLDLKQHPGLQISHNRLRARRPQWDKVLQAGLQCAAEQHGYFQHYKYTTERGSNFRLPLVLGETDDGRVVVCTLFVRDGMTFVETQSDDDLKARLNVARAVFGLSDGQMAVAQHIVSGENLKTASDTLGISINTARTHLNRIYAKTGINSQTALVRTLLSVG